MHILEDHVVPWIQRWRVSSGLMGEQGSESIHAYIKNLERVYKIPNEVEKLLYIFKEQAIESDPGLSSLRPPPKKKKKNLTDTEGTATA